jgi:hypothetical protein
MSLYDELEEVINQLDQIKEKIQRREETGGSDILKVTSVIGSTLYILMSEIESVCDLSSMKGTDTSGAVIRTKSGESYKINESAQTILDSLDLLPS